MIDPVTTGTIITKGADLLDKLRKLQKNKEVYDIVRDLQAEQSKLETKIKEAESEVTRLNDELAKLKEKHATEIAQLKQAHADEITRMTAQPGRVIPEVDDDYYHMGDLGNPL